MIQAGADIHAEDVLEYTPLHAAVESDESSPRVLEALLTAGSDPNANGANGIAGTPLHAAAIANQPWVLETLLQAGANPNAGDFDSMTPLHTAGFANPNPKVIEVLLKGGADVNFTAKSAERAQQAGYSPLHAAAKSTRNPEVIHALLKAGANMEALNRDGYTPLHVAADANRTPEVLQAIIKAGANIHAKNPEGFTPL